MILRLSMYMAYVRYWLNVPVVLNSYHSSIEEYQSGNQWSLKDLLYKQKT